MLDLIVDPDAIGSDIRSILVNRLRAISAVGCVCFEYFGDGPLDLEQLPVIEGDGVTHVKYRIIK